MIQILHCADAHLDAPFVLSDICDSELRRRELRESFRNMMRYVREQNIDILLIAGDLFDARNVRRETVELVREEFEKTPNTRIFISPGNHDPYTSGSVWQTTTFPQNVAVFRENALARISMPDLGVDVYGYAFTDTALPYNPAATFHLARPNYINLLCAHGDLTSTASKYCPITAQDIEHSNLDYIALGHIHNATRMQMLARTRFAYAGCLEGRSFDECGHKGAIHIEMDKSPQGDVTFREKRVWFSQRRYEKEDVDITGVQDDEEVKARLRATIESRGYGDDTALRLTLVGTVPPTLQIRTSELLREGKGLYLFEVENRTLPLYDAGYLERDRGIRGAFFAELRQMLEQGSEEERELATLALHYGLSALADEDLTGRFGG